MRQIDFFYFFGSVYAGLSILRIRQLAEGAGIRVRWRPFNVRPLMQENNVAQRSEVRKVKYMWRDIARRAALHDVPYVTQPVWPTDPQLLHNKVSMLAAQESWIEPFTLASIRAWFTEAWRSGTRPASTMCCANAARIGPKY